MHLTDRCHRPAAAPNTLTAPQSTLDDRLRALRSASENSIASIPCPSSPPPTPAPITSNSKRQPGLGAMSAQHHHGIGHHGAVDTERFEKGKDTGNGQGGEVEKMKEDYTKRASQGVDEALKYLKDEGHSPTEEDVDRALASARKISPNKVVTEETKPEAKPESPNKLTRQKNRPSYEEYMGPLGFVAAETSKIAKRNLSCAANAKALHALPHPDLPGTDLEEYHQQFLEGFDDFGDSEEGDETHQEHDEDEEADVILAELMDDVDLDFTEDAETKEHDEQEDRLRKSSLDSPGTVPFPPSKPNSTSPPQQQSQERRPIPEASERNEDQQEVDHFHKVMAARMSALRTPPPKSDSNSPILGLPEAPSSPPVDFLGLPSAPTSRLSGRTDSQSPKRTAPKYGYICAICYAPATIFCEGCEEGHGGDWGDTKENAMYCARCWREGHMGESAGIEERGHTWVSVGLGE